MDAAKLKEATGCTDAAAQKWAEPLTRAMVQYVILLPLRQSAFLAQVAHECGLFTVLEENLRYSAEGLLRVFGKYFNGQQADDYARRPEQIANRVYANRMGNGDEASGDGWRFRGRGLIQMTGRDNYAAAGRALGLDLEANPDLLLEPSWAAMSAGWFWHSRNLNLLADNQEFLGITRAVNGGTNGLAERRALYVRAKTALGIA